MDTLKIPEGEFPLVCDCKNEDGTPNSTNHKTYLDKNNEIVVECIKTTTGEGENVVTTGCGRFRKYPAQ